MGNLRKIQIDLEKHPPHYDVEIADIIQCFINFPLTPSESVDAINISFGGQSLAKIGVVITSDFALMGSGQMSAFFYIYGNFTGNDEFITVRLIPVIAGQPTPAHEITFKVPLIEP